MLPDPFDVLEVTLGPAARILPLHDDVRVVRTADRADHPAGNAVHHLTPLGAGVLGAAVADLGRRFPKARARLVAPMAPELAAASMVEGGMVPSVIEVLRRDPRQQPPASRADLELLAARDDRDWHGITVLHRHAVAPGEDRSRGRHDDRLGWWVAGLRQLVGTGRARVLRAVRFGTPVGVGLLHWAPGVAVGDDHAGLAVVADVVVHPAHRGIGVGRAITEALVVAHLADFPRARVTAVAEHVPGQAVHADRGDHGDHGDHGVPGSPAPDPPSGWRRHARLLALTRGEGSVGR